MTTRLPRGWLYQAKRDTRGAVYVEFLIAFFPVFVMFLSLIQLADLHQANIIVHHAAIMASRSAVVILHDDPKYYNDLGVGEASGKRLDAIKKAAMMPLLASRSLTEFRVTLPTNPGGDDSKDKFNRNDLVRLRIQAHFNCRVPVVSKLVCGSESIRTITAEAAMPNQGADYTY